MNEKQNITLLQNAILEIMKFIDKVSRENNIEYFIMGGTALGAVRHKGFIPWDDDLDIFMTIDNYYKFKKCLSTNRNDEYFLQEWSVVDGYLEYAKLRKNNTTYIEENYKNERNMHHGIFVDIMILHKCKKNYFELVKQYFISKYVTLYALSKRNWKPNTYYKKLCLRIVNKISFRLMLKMFYRYIYKWDYLKSDYYWIYYITKAKLKQGKFKEKIFSKTKEIQFCGIMLYGPNDINQYLKIRYGNYMILPNKEEQKLYIHAKYFNTEIDYKNYFINNG